MTKLIALVATGLFAAGTMFAGEHGDCVKKVGNEEKAACQASVATLNLSAEQKTKMDAVMADVTDVPGPPVTPADEFTLIGSQGDERITVADLALVRTTNAWEVVTAMARRLPRVYDAAPGVLDLRTLTDRSG